MLTERKWRELPGHKDGAKRFWVLQYFKRRQETHTRKILLKQSHRKKIVKHCLCKE